MTILLTVVHEQSEWWQYAYEVGASRGNIQKHLVLVDTFWWARVNRAGLDNFNLSKKASIPRLQDSWVNQESC